MVGSTVGGHGTVVQSHPAIATLASSARNSSNCGNLNRPPFAGSSDCVRQDEPSAGVWAGLAGDTDDASVCFDNRMPGDDQLARVVTVSREISASAGTIFELIADPAQQPRWDGNDNLATAPDGQRVRAVGDVFTVILTHNGATRENHVVEFDEGRRIAWKPAEPGHVPPGHLWRWELEPIDAFRTQVTHTYDWTQLVDQKRLSRARSTTAEKLQASLARLAALAEEG